MMESEQEVFIPGSESSDYESGSQVRSTPKRLEEVMQSISSESEEGADRQEAPQMFRIQSKAAKDIRPERTGIPDTLKYSIEPIFTSPSRGRNFNMISKTSLPSSRKKSLVRVPEKQVKRPNHSPDKKSMTSILQRENSLTPNTKI
jgi:hypothetical protein